MAMLDLVAPGDIHSRVASALSLHLMHINEDEDLSGTIKNDFIQLKNSLKVESAAAGHVVEVINSMSEIDAEKLAQRIVILYEQLISV
jgi:hypothetical protein